MGEKSLHKKPSADCQFTYWLESAVSRQIADLLFWCQIGNFFSLSSFCERSVSCQSQMF